MPWAIASQTIPILALAPMIIVMLGAIGIQGLLPKAVISAYLSFFPVVVGMVKGLRSPDAMQLDLLRTYYASPAQGFWKLRLPASVPYLFASLKIGISASLVGAIVAELPTGARAGFGARMLVGDQYGQPLVTWAALFAAALTAAALVGFFSLAERWTLRRMGMQRYDGHGDHQRVGDLGWRVGLSTRGWPRVPLQTPVWSSFWCLRSLV